MEPVQPGWVQAPARAPMELPATVAAGEAAAPADGAAGEPQTSQ